MIVITKLCPQITFNAFRNIQSTEFDLITLQGEPHFRIPRCINEKNKVCLTRNVLKRCAGGQN